jgi:predicted RecB family nuclease
MGISKSKFISGLNCEKRLFLEVNHPELKSPISADQESKFNSGHRIGALAQERFSGGVNAEPQGDRNFKEWLNSTRLFLAEKRPVIYEAAFSFEGSFCALDILIREEDDIVAIEVKGSKEAKEIFIMDAAYQYYIMSQLGVQPKRFYLLLIDGTYIREKILDVQQLFQKVDITDRVVALQAAIKENLDKFNSMLAAGMEPRRNIGPHCSSPYSCPFYNHCSAHLPKANPITSLRGSADKVWDLHEKGCYSIEDIPSNYPLQARQIAQVNGVKSGTSILNAEPIRKFLAEVEYPLHFFDFETVWPAIPVAEGISPFGHLAFQYSMHIMNSEGGVSHREYLANPEAIFQGENTEYDLIQQMKVDFHSEGSIVAYNATFEKNRLKDMKKRFPSESDFLEGLISRFVDLMVLFRPQSIYYLPEMKGSYSIKNVLPAIAPEFSYSDLEIGNGGEASSIFESKCNGSYEGDWSETRTALLKYCERDTYGMIVIWNHLHECL